VTVTHRGGAAGTAELAGTDLLGAFAGKTVSHLHAISLRCRRSRRRLGHARHRRLGAAGIARNRRLAAVNGALEASVAPLAVELAPRRVNAISPGVIETGWWDGLPDDARRETFATFAQRASVGRNGTAEDVADAIAALAGNRFITGVVLSCDGGLRLT
jgi:NAD(P)-dependent dehydrogenase (short-subunit alcohol dehydrogenase family)